MFWIQQNTCSEWLIQLMRLFQIQLSWWFFLFVFFFYTRPRLFSNTWLHPCQCEEPPFGVYLHWLNSPKYSLVRGRLHVQAHHFSPSFDDELSQLERWRSIEQSFDWATASLSIKGSTENLTIWTNLSLFGKTAKTFLPWAKQNLTSILRQSKQKKRAKFAVRAATAGDSEHLRSSSTRAVIRKVEVLMPDATSGWQNSVEKKIYILAIIPL